jgi:hypothetical protein
LHDGDLFLQNDVYQFIFVFKVLVDGFFGDAQLAADVIHGYRADAQAHKLAFGLCNDSVSQFHIFLFGAAKLWKLSTDKKFLLKKIS